MFYVVGGLIALAVLWVLSEYYTDRKFDIVVERLEVLEKIEAERMMRAPRIVVIDGRTVPGASDGEGQNGKGGV